MKTHVYSLSIKVVVSLPDDVNPEDIGVWGHNAELFLPNKDDPSEVDAVYKPIESTETVELIHCMEIE